MTTSQPQNRSGLGQHRGRSLNRHDVARDARRYRDDAPRSRLRSSSYVVRDIVAANSAG